MSANDRMAPRADNKTAAVPDEERQERNSIAPAVSPHAQAIPSWSGNHLASDEPFSAGHAQTSKPLPPEVEARYLRIGDNYYSRTTPPSLAFHDKGNRLETATDSARVADALVRIAQARGWDEIRVSGFEQFRREVWIEASARGMQVKGYTPTEQDRAELARRAPASAAAEQDRQDLPDGQQDAPHTRAQAFARQQPAEAVRQHPELAGAYAAQSSMQKQVEAAPLTPPQRAVVMERVRQNLINSIERGERPDVKLRQEPPQRSHQREPEATR